eukprot:3941757-Rhodomonas_salina.1
MRDRVESAWVERDAFAMCASVCVVWQGDNSIPIVGTDRRHPPTLSAYALPGTELRHVTVPGYNSLGGSFNGEGQCILVSQPPYGPPRFKESLDAIQHS